MKINIQSQSDKVSPYRLKSGRFTVSVHTKNEANRIREFIIKMLGNKNGDD